MDISITVNGQARTDDVEPRTLLVHWLREGVGLTGTNVGCDTTSCGACTVLLDGQSVKSCTVLAVQADGSDVLTIEGLAPMDGDLHPVQQAFHENHALQCGFCTPGMVMAAVSLLDDVSDPSEQDVRKGLEGNLCRCTGYHNIVRAVLARGREPIVIPVAFDYVRASSADEAITLLGEHGDDAKLLAGGHSLLPLMKLRLATPSVIVDIGRLGDLSYVRVDGEEVCIGSLTRHCEVERSELVAAEVPLLAHVAGCVGDRQVRHRGTIGGSLAHGDGASDLPAAVLALNGMLVMRGPDGERRVQAQDFFTGFLETALAPDELLTEIRVPRVPTAGWSYRKFTKRAADWAIVGAVAVRGADTGVGLVNMGPTPLRASAVEQALADGASDADAAMQAAVGTDPAADINAGIDYRQHLARVLVRRALEESASRANGDPIR